MLASGAAMVGGQLLNSAANRSAVNARNRAMEAERARQQAFSADAFKALDQSQAALTRPAQDAALAQAVQARTAGNEAAIDPATEYAASGTAPAVVKTEMARRMADALAAGRETAAQLGALRGFGDLQFDNQLTLGKSGRDIALRGSFAQGSSNVLPYELAAASQKGSGRRTVADILGGLGSVGLMAGATGNDPFSAMFKPVSGNGATAMARAAGAFG